MPVPWLGAGLQWVLFAGVLGLGWFFRARAPAVAMGMLGVLVGWPAHAQLLGLLVFGVAGLVIAPRVGPRYLRRGSVVALSGVVAAIVLDATFHRWVCPPWVPAYVLPPGCGDGRVMWIVVVGAVLLASLFLASAFRAADRNVRDEPPAERRRALMGAGIGVGALVALGLFVGAPGPPRIEASVVARGRWRLDDCRSVPVGSGDHASCVIGARAESAAFTLTLHNAEASDIDIDSCFVRVSDLQGKRLAPKGVSVPILAERPSGSGVVHGGETDSFAWFVNGVPSSSIGSYTADCDAYFDPGPQP